jgi:hypothetical protein
MASEQAKTEVSCWKTTTRAVGNPGLLDYHDHIVHSNSARVGAEVNVERTSRGHCAPTNSHGAVAATIGVKGVI